MQGFSLKKHSQGYQERTKLSWNFHEKLRERERERLDKKCLKYIKKMIDRLECKLSWHNFFCKDFSDIFQQLNK